MCHIVDWLLADFIPLSDSLRLTLPHFSSQENGIESVFLFKKEKKSGCVTHQLVQDLLISNLVIFSNFCLLYLLISWSPTT